MAKVLFVWELGGGIGHITKYLSLIDGLRRLGHEAAFALRDVRFAETLLGTRGIPWFQAPVMLGRPPDETSAPHSFAQILHNVGYGNVEYLTALARAWRQLYDSYQPDLIVFDHSPTALIAARERPVRKVVSGIGFCVPLDTNGPLILRTDPPPNPEQVAADEQRILGNINQVLKRLGCAPVARVTEIYQADDEVVWTFRELDQIRERQQLAGVNYWGAGETGSGASPEWPAVEGQRIFAYIKPFNTLPSLLETLQRLGHPTLIYAPELDDRVKQHFAGATLTFSERSLDLTQTAARTDLAITHAGHTTTSLLLAGIPQLLLPLHLEQRLTADNVERLGAGLSAPALHPDGMALKLRALLSDTRYRAAAQAFAKRYADFDPAAMEQRLVGRVNDLLRQP